jgi:Flp pilus assembly protein TadB
MAGPTYVERIIELVQLTATLDAQVVALRERAGIVDDTVAGIRETQREIDRRLSMVAPELELKLTAMLNEMDRRLSHATRDLERLEKKLDDRRERHWEVAKIVITAFVSAIVSTVVVIASERFKSSRPREGVESTPKVGAVAPRQP